MTNKCTVGADIIRPIAFVCGKMVSSPTILRFVYLREDGILPYGIIVHIVGADIIRPMGIKKEATKGRPYEILIIIQ